MPRTIGMRHATLRGWHCWWGGAEVSCFVLVSTLLVGWLVNCRPVCQIVNTFAKTPSCSTAVFGWVFPAGGGGVMFPTSQQFVLSGLVIGLWHVYAMLLS